MTPKIEVPGFMRADDSKPAVYDRYPVWYEYRAPVVLIASGLLMLAAIVLSGAVTW
jgi:hypothetical protein